MSMESHLQALRAKHTALDTRIHDEETRPSSDPVVIHDLKRQKLEIKDELSRMSQ